MKHDMISNLLFVKNRRKLYENLEDNSLTVICSNIQMPRNGDQYYPFRQDSDFFYLTGLDQDDVILVIEKMGSVIHEYIFTRETNEQIELWNGPRPDRKETSAISGVEDVRWLDQFIDYLSGALRREKKLYLNLSGNRRLITDFNSNAEICLQTYFRQLQRFSKLKPKDICPVINLLRVVKEPEEIELIRKAISITKQAYLSVLSELKPDMHEYEVEAILRKEMLSRGAADMSFAPIVASGKNACILHYINNDNICKNGDMVMMDFGAEYANYAADCSRTFPVNGKYSERQKEIYQMVLDVYKAAQSYFKPGATIAEVNNRTGALMQEKLLNLGLISEVEIANQSEDYPAYKKFYPHGTTHFIGLDVHDVGERDLPFLPGMVLSCEPGIYIRDEGIGIRIETDMLITETGAENMLADYPVEIAEIESLMKR